MEQVRICHGRQVITPPRENIAAFQEDERMRAKLRETVAHHRFVYNATCASEILLEREYKAEQRNEKTSLKGEAYQRLLKDLREKNDELKMQNCEIRNRTDLYEKNEAEELRRYRDLLQKSTNSKEFDLEAAKELLLNKRALYLSKPYEYIRELPGKNVRGKLVDAFQLWLNVVPDTSKAIKTIVNGLHDASLLIDDIEDNSDLRRGRPVAHHIYGIPATINCANYVYFLSLQRCQELQNTRAMSTYVTEMLRLHQGQGLDIYWRDQCACPSIEDYLEMVKNKTGGLFRLAVGMLQAFSDCQTDFTPLLDVLSIYFQIRDDYVNLFNEAYMENKSFGEDLSEGKFSYPLIVAIQANPNDTRLLNIMKQRTKDVEVKKYAIQYLEKQGAAAQTKAKLDDLHGNIKSQLDGIGGNPILEKIMDSLHSSIG
ncbi:unnamed protein product [Albugo candida]|uniref:Geranylgeranyl pyrophosphate synthase n=1 Tax=Albugo candida TaxID=65357 RepID=A0A024GF38_9STRA|nr:unnamed protein product [Albugo candida]|eukprot:CCI44927.1 unnamed protein product [Albugo candida]